MISTSHHLNHRAPGFCRRVLLAGLTLLTGCQSSLSSNELRGPAVAARFTTNPLADTKFDRDYVPPPATVPSLKLGLNMQSGIDPVHSHFASNLGTVLMRELQISSATLAVEPLVSLQPQAAVPHFPQQSTDGIISVAFTSPQDGLPPQLPPNPMYHSEALPIVDQILVVRVIEYRPYYPLRATLDVQVLDGQSQDPVFATTATWSGEEYESGGKKISWKKTLFCRDPACLPAPGHNSPQALIHEIAGDLAAWYNHASTSLIVTTAKPEKSWRGSWKRMFEDDSCPPAASCPTPSAPVNSPPTSMAPTQITGPGLPGHAPAINPTVAVPETFPAETQPVLPAPPAESPSIQPAPPAEVPSGTPAPPVDSASPQPTTASSSGVPAIRQAVAS